MLDQIMAQPATALTAEEKAVLEAREKAATEKLKKKKRPLTIKEFFARVLAGSFGVAVILGTIVGYIIFNPEQAVFINQIFGIAIGDVARILRLFLRVTFGTVLVISMGVWMYYLIRSFLKSIKGFKKVVAVTMAIVCGAFFIGVLAAWARVEKELAAFEYLDATIVLYDNDVYLQLPQDQKEAARITNVAELIGPISIRFDLDGFTRRKEKELGIRSITRFEMDFDGDGQSDMDGNEVVGNQSFIWKYDRSKTGKAYQPTGTIYGIDVNNKEVAIVVPFPTISVVASVRIVETKESTGDGVRVAFDAKELKPRGNVEWYVESASGTVASTAYEFTPADVFTKTQWVCLNIFQGEKSDGKCKKYFVIRGEGGNLIDGKISLIPDPVDYLNYKFVIKDLVFKQGVKESVKWYVGSLLQGDGDAITHRFPAPDTYDVRAVVRDTSGNEKSFPQRLVIDDPISIMSQEGYGLKLVDESGKDIISGTFDKATKSYIVEGVSFLQTLSFDASGIKAASPSLSLVSADWDLDGDGQFELSGALSAKFLLKEEKVYTARVRYNFVNRTYDGERPRSYTDTVTISAQRNAFDIRLKAIPDQDFAPAQVTLDASSSQARDGEIVKFIFDYGDGNPVAENSKGQVIHRYVTPGTYTAKVTAFKNDGTNQSKTVIFTIRKPQNVATINTSVSRGRAGLTVTFDANESRGNPQQILWDFGDGTTGIGEKTDHAFAKAGTYQIKLEIHYSDGAVETDKRAFVVLPNPTEP